jgi:hypothetical protein
MRRSPRVGPAPQASQSMNSNMSREVRGALIVKRPYRLARLTFYQRGTATEFETFNSPRTRTC